MLCYSKVHSKHFVTHNFPGETWINKVPSGEMLQAQPFSLASQKSLTALPWVKNVGFNTSHDVARMLVCH